MPRDLRLRSGVVVPGRAVRLRAVRSSGAGGQNVNKVSSKVELHVDLGGILGLDTAAARRLRALAANRLDAGGRLVLRSQRTRDQHRNVGDVYDRLRELIERALVAPRIRRLTHATAASRERRLAGKKARGTLKQSRREGAAGDE
jgi:ribosome-associated protein